LAPKHEQIEKLQQFHQLLLMPSKGSGPPNSRQQFGMETTIFTQIRRVPCATLENAIFGNKDTGRSIGDPCRIETY
jgi:hypothetical protein